MKVGLVTINDNNNYGNRLQNYAIQEVILKNIDNSSVVTIRNDAYSNQRKFYVLKAIKNIRYKGTYSSNIGRKNNFLKFNKNIKFSRKKANPFICDNSYDFVITGSDQVWNPKYNRMSDVDLLSFVKPEKRIAFSASFGVGEIEEKYHKKLKNELMKFKAISVREDSGKSIISDVVSRDDVSVLVDPTMLLSGSEWDKVSSKPNNMTNKKYILNYFLGSISDKRRDEIERIARDNDCDIINILDKDGPYYECGPSEFLYLEKNAFLICTDSFHSSIFAILYHVPFLVFDRDGSSVNMNSRLDTLLKKFNLEDRKVKNDKISSLQLSCNYDKVDSVLEKEREKSINWLKEALNVRNGDIK